MSQPIWFDSTETGAPTLNNAAGSLIGLLRACLRDGFGVKSITGITVASGVATVQCPTHGFSSTYGKLVKITGASAGALNGNKQPTVVDGNNFTFPAPGVADGSYTATDARRAPLGWTEAYTNGGGTVSIFQRTAPEANAQMLRVDDSNTGGTLSEARVLIVESATGVSSYSGAAPTDASLSGGAYLSKGPNSATAKDWVLVGDERAFWIFTRYNSFATNWSFATSFFGDGVPYVAGDAYFTMLMSGSTAGSGSNTSSRAGVDSGLRTFSSSVSSVASRASSGAGAAIQIAFGATGIGAIGNSGFGQAGGGNVVIHQPLWVVDSALTIRGEAPGLAAPLARVPFTNKQIVTPVDGSGKTFLSILHTGGDAADGCLLIDLTGPWY